MREGGIDDGATAGESEADVRKSRLVVPLFRNRDVNLVVDSDYWMFVAYRGDEYALPQNGVLKFVALALVAAVVVRQLSISVGNALRRVASLVDGVFERVYEFGRATNAVVASERTGRLLTNVKKLLVILALLLFILDGAGAVDVVALPKWLLSL